MSTVTGRSLELYYIDGRPDGMLTAELFNWTGHVLMTPRTQLATALKRPEAKNAGIYLLIGEQEGQPLAYVGESEDIGTRIKNHDANKDWWTSAILVTAAGNKLNKAHVRYLEARLIAEAHTIGTMLLENGTKPPLPTLSEADAAKMEAFLENLLIVLPAVRLDMFIQRVRPSVKAKTPLPAQDTTSSTALSEKLPADEPVVFTLAIPKHNLQATARLQGGELIVEAGSKARSAWVGAVGHHYASLHASLVQAGVLAIEGNHRVFAKDYAFGSPSAAAAVITGRSSNGQVLWHLKGHDLTYKDWEADQLAVTSTDAA